ncbi:ATP-dependent DNA ligase [Epidermidibacterium keratini]|uniref:DNA ligase (ATP) n=1 Tax=Epidermidibacterium keratini TaxID=1891644 RepID=A0A7L4YSC4_9ACTN|nr:ATP-dependent DNA ligase [Epidermidibacterium keratini]QHC01980.1 ATP-dependent DNA ligase [Epidermidibacterium keratini]
MTLPVTHPLQPTLAKPAKSLPTGEGWIYEPKWDGFRAIVFKDGDEIEIGSRASQPLTRYFPELVAHLREQLPPRCVLDGEIIVETDGRLDFDALQQRIHPADSRVQMLAEKTPASMMIFDLIALGDESLMSRPLGERRSLLRSELDGVRPPLYLTPETTSAELAMQWFVEFEGAGLDGLIAKPLDSAYEPGARIYAKLKHQRDLDAVIAGFRWHKSGGIVGSLMLGLYDDDGALHYIGATSAFSMKRRAELVEELAPYRVESLSEHPWGGWKEAMDGERKPGNLNRWNAGKDMSWEAVRPELVVEIGYDQFQGPRLRHLGKFRRFRPDRDPRSCTLDQIERPEDYPFSGVLAYSPTT